MVIRLVTVVALLIVLLFQMFPTQPASARNVPESPVITRTLPYAGK